MTEDITRAAEAAHSVLRERWGAEYEHKVELASRALQSGDGQFVEGYVRDGSIVAVPGTNQFEVLDPDAAEGLARWAVGLPASHPAKGNPYKTGNMTAQADMERRNPQRAAALMREAGKSVPDYLQPKKGAE